MPKKQHTVDKPRETGISTRERPSRSDFGVQTPNSEADSRATRLRQAIRDAGGNKAVAERASVPVGTLNNYLAGGEMKLTPTIALAEACNVSIEWLATGKGSMHPGMQRALPSSAEPPPSVPDLATTLDMQMLADCIESAFERLARPGRSIPWLSIARVTCLIYNEMVDIEAREKAAAEPSPVNATSQNER